MIDRSLDTSHLGWMWRIYQDRKHCQIEINGVPCLYWNEAGATVCLVFLDKYMNIVKYSDDVVTSGLYAVLEEHAGHVTFAPQMLEAIEQAVKRDKSHRIRKTDGSYYLPVNLKPHGTA